MGFIWAAFEAFSEIPLQNTAIRLLTELGQREHNANFAWPPSGFPSPIQVAGADL